MGLWWDQSRAAWAGSERLLRLRLTPTQKEMENEGFKEIERGITESVGFKKVGGMQIVN